MTRTPLRLRWALFFLFTISCGVWVWRARQVPAPQPGPVGTDDQQQPVSARGLVLGKAVRDGIQVECRITPLADSEGHLREGEDANFEFTITDTTGKTPLRNIYPAAWVVSHPDNTPPLSPREAVRRAETLLNGSLFNPPELDLNFFYVLVLNGNATLSVVDPRFGFGGARLRALVPLAARGDDWALGPGARQVFVAMPEVNQVAVVDTLTWKVTANVPAGIRPRRLALQRDGRYLWVAGGAGADSGVTVLDTSNAKVVARLRTGRGEHEIALSDDSRHAFVTNTIDGTASIIDAGQLQVVATVEAGRPASIAYSSRARLAYVTDAAGGILGIDEAGRVVNRIKAPAGLAPIRFSPSGDAGFAVSTSENRLYILDPTSNRLVQQTQTEDGPDQITFSTEFAYIRHRRSANVLLVSLKTTGKEGAPLSVARFPAGEGPPGTMNHPTPADSIVPAPGASAVLVANPKGRSVHYYREGLSAPMGTFSNYQREPRAVLALDRGLRERERPGVYQTVARLERAGKFDVVFFLDQPRIVHACLFEVRPNAAREAARNRGKIDVESLVLPRAEAGKRFRPLLQLTDRATKALKTGLTDVEVLVFRADTGWHERRTAQEVAPGVYGADFVPPQAGVYEVFVSCESTSGPGAQPQRGLILHVVDADPPVGGPAR
jgi:YVTN family beta-propeller protein